MFMAVTFSYGGDNRPATFIGIFSTLDQAKKSLVDYLDDDGMVFEDPENTEGSNYGTWNKKKQRVDDFMGMVTRVEVDVIANMDL